MLDEKFGTHRSSVDVRIGTDHRRNQNQKEQDPTWRNGHPPAETTRWHWQVALLDEMIFTRIVDQERLTVHNDQTWMDDRMRSSELPFSALVAI